MKLKVEFFLSTLQGYTKYCNIFHLSRTETRSKLPAAASLISVSTTVGKSDCCMSHLESSIFPLSEDQDQQFSSCYWHWEKCRHGLSRVKGQMSFPFNQNIQRINGLRNKSRYRQPFSTCGEALPSFSPSPQLPLKSKFLCVTLYTFCMYCVASRSGASPSLFLVF